MLPVPLPCPLRGRAADLHHGFDLRFLCLVMEICTGGLLRISATRRYSKTLGDQEGSETLAPQLYIPLFPFFEVFRM